MRRWILGVVCCSLSCVASEREESGAPEELGSVEQETVWNFYNTINCTGQNPLSFLGYGCFCGPGNSGDSHDPVDPTDACCKTHDACYATGIEGCNCMSSAIRGNSSEYTTTCTDHVPTCNPNQGACAAACCACDVAAANCFADTADSFQPDCFGQWDRPQHCREGAQSCCSDADCPDMERCEESTCVLIEPCETDADCASSGRVCEDGVCVPIDCGGDGCGGEGSGGAGTGGSGTGGSGTGGWGTGGWGTGGAGGDTSGAGGDTSSGGWGAGSGSAGGPSISSSGGPDVQLAE